MTDSTNSSSPGWFTRAVLRFWLLARCWSLVRHGILKGSKLGVEKIQGSGLKPPNSQVMSTKWEMLDVYSRLWWGNLCSMKCNYIYTPKLFGHDRLDKFIITRLFYQSSPSILVARSLLKPCSAWHPQGIKTRRWKNPGFWFKVPQLPSHFYKMGSAGCVFKIVIV